MKKKTLLSLTALAISSFGLMAGVNAAEDSWAALKTCLTTVGEKTCTVGNITDSSSENDNNLIIKDTKTLDLGGKTLSLANSTRFIIESGDSLTITNGTIEKSTRSGVITVRVGATLTVKGDAKIESKINDNIAVISIIGSTTDNAVKTTVNLEKGSIIKGTVGVNTAAVGSNVSYGVVINTAGTIEANGDSNALTINGKVTSNDGNVPVINVLDGAVITSNGNAAIYAAGYGVWNISGGTITGREAIGIKAGEIKITGGDFEANGSYVANPTEKEGLATATGAAISVTNGGSSYGGNIKLSIENATVKSENGYAIYEDSGNEENTALKELSIKSGNYTGGSEVENAALKFDSSESDETELFKSFISGGTFTGKIDNSYLSENVVQTENGEVNKLYTITVETENGIVTVNKNAIAGEKVKIAYKANEGYKLDKIIVTYEKNGKETEVKVAEDGTFVMPDDNIIIKVLFTKIDVTTDVTPNEAPATFDDILGYVALTILSLGSIAIVSKKILSK